MASYTAIWCCVAVLVVVGVNCMENEENLIRERIEKLEALNDNLKQQLNGQKIVYNDLLNELATSSDFTVRDNDHQKRQSLTCDGPVVFHARLQNSIYPIGTNQIIAYEDVVTNVGNGYDSFTGLFRAPVGGAYEFVATMWSSDGNYLEFEMVRNGVDLCYGRASQSNQTMGTCVSMVELSAGDRVWVRHLSGRGTYANGADYPSFVGHLIV
ncbi:C1q-related factor-like [Ylistrum balloti]|uniref:C1q-related factor-like n=1 Tax=Ylistrum balloti TaxID=509963 RepID=UPI002905A13E|nr:C1q-related factor-like [Ylistrum balloti]